MFVWHRMYISTVHIIVIEMAVAPLFSSHCAMDGVESALINDFWVK